jgi:hypothetical protein
MSETTVATPAGLRISGKQSASMSDAAESGLFHLSQGTLVAARGKVKRGGIEFGLRILGKQKRQASVKVRGGEFLAVLEVPATGDYSMVITDGLGQPSLKTDVDIMEIGLVGLDPSLRRLP